MTASRRRTAYQILLTRSGSEIVSDRVDNAKAMTLALESREWMWFCADYTMPNSTR